MNWNQKAQIFRDRFYGRQDVFGKQWQSKKEDGSIAKGYNPSCDNIWVDKCHIKLRDSISCSDCEIQKFTPVEDKTVLMHIRGDEPQMHYMLQPDGTIRFGAFDFDYKPGKEHLGHTFEDVKKVIKVVTDWGMPYVLARSTGNGFHIYFFFEEFYSARKFRSVIYEIMDRCGFMEENAQGLRPLPEVFPKQNHLGAGGLGNGIKPPMIEPQFEKGRNCLIDDSGEMIPIDEQWNHLNNAGKIKTKFMDDLIEKFGIVLESERSVSTSGRVGAKKSSSGPVNGSIEKVLEGCLALRNLREKIKTGYVPGHFEGFGLYHMAMNTLDGKEWFINNVSGWGKDSNGMKQLEHSENKGYSPWTCKNMQNHGLCVIGTKCFDKKAPVEYVEGRPVVRTDIPESEWPEPSPVRYALGKGDDFLKKLMQEVDDASAVEDIEHKAQLLTGIINRASVFDITQQATLKVHIENKKIARKSDVNKLFNQANTDRSQKIQETVAENSEYFVLGGSQFKYLNPGYAIMRAGRKGGENIEQQLSNCFIDILEERTIIEDTVTKKKIFFGRFTSNNFSTDFEMDAKGWADNGEFYSFFVVLCGTSMQVKKSDVDVLRNVIHYTSEIGRPGVTPCRKTTYYSAPGWYDNMFITQSVVVDKDGVRPNTERPVYANANVQDSFLDFELMSDGDFTETLFHIKKDLLEAFHKDQMMLALGFTMMAPMIKYLGIEHKPAMWLEGKTGNGKTEFCVALQKFYGAGFKGGVGWNSTGRGIADYTHQFKDCMLYIDDWKDATAQQRSAALELLQYSYDHVVRAAMTKDGDQRGDKHSRCLVLTTGEEAPQNNASVLARMIVIDYPQIDVTKAPDAYKRVKEYQSHYCGVMARFLNWVLNQDKVRILDLLHHYRQQLIKPINEAQNSARISFNIAMALTGWHMFVDFMRDNRAIAEKEEILLKDSCYEYACDVRDVMVNRCKDEQSVNILINRLSELLASGEVGIKNLDGYSNDRVRTWVGFVDATDTDPHAAYLYPNITIEVVKKHMSNPLIITSHSAGLQMKEDKILLRVDEKGKRTSVTKKEDGRSTRVWCIDVTKLGISVKPRVVGGTRPMDFDQPMPNAEGLI